MFFSHLSWSATSDGSLGIVPPLVNKVTAAGQLLSILVAELALCVLGFFGSFGQLLFTYLYAIHGELYL